jgi:chemosensory pili system protein ChpA (sensor histidine kinase/response regulator)
MSHILIVEVIEDDPQLKKQYATVLQRHGYQVHTARDTASGLKVLADISPDIIILDLLMPGPDGVAFLEAADLEHLHPHTRVIVLSNVDTPDYEQQLSRFHVERYLLKADYTPDQLADLIARIA